MTEEIEAELREYEVYKDLPYFECGDGWSIILAQVGTLLAHRAKNDKTFEMPKAVQCKEKFGGLRLYTDRADEYTGGVIAMAEAMAWYTCDVCGNRGHNRKRRGVLCDEHALPPLEYLATVKTGDDDE